MQAACCNSVRLYVSKYIEAFSNNFTVIKKKLLKISLKYGLDYYSLVQT